MRHREEQLRRCGTTDQIAILTRSVVASILTLHHESIPIDFEILWLDKIGIRMVVGPPKHVG